MLIDVDKQKLADNRHLRVLCDRAACAACGFLQRNTRQAAFSIRFGTSKVVSVFFHACIMGSILGLVPSSQFALSPKPSDPTGGTYMSEMSQNTPKLRPDFSVTLFFVMSAFC
jgi:hypothetical protein